MRNKPARKLHRPDHVDGQVDLYELICSVDPGILEQKCHDSALLCYYMKKHRPKLNRDLPREIDVWAQTALASIHEPHLDILDTVDIWNVGIKDHISHYVLKEWQNRWAAEAIKVDTYIYSRATQIVDAVKSIFDESWIDFSEGVASGDSQSADSGLLRFEACIQIRTSIETKSSFSELVPGDLKSCFDRPDELLALTRVRFSSNRLRVLTEAQEIYQKACPRMLEIEFKDVA